MDRNALHFFALLLGGLRGAQPCDGLQSLIVAQRVVWARGRAVVARPLLRPRIRLIGGWGQIARRRIEEVSTRRLGGRRR